MQRDRYIKEITENLHRFEMDICTLNKMNLQDVNIHAENFYRDLLNLVYGWKLKNANTIKSNFPGIDLCFESERIGVQVSSDCSKSKINNSLEKSKGKSDFRIKFVFIKCSAKDLRNKTYKIPNGIRFDPQIDIYDADRIIMDVSDKEIEELERIHKLVIDELKTVDYSSEKVQRHFTYNIQTDLQPRDLLVDSLLENIKNHNVVNVIGIGGSGKTSLISLFINKYKSNFNQIAYVVVNSDIKSCIVNKLNSDLRLEFDERESLDNKYSRIIREMESSDFSSNSDNLLVLDINSFGDDADGFLKYMHNLVCNFGLYNINPKGWKIIVVSRQRVNDNVLLFELNNAEGDFLKNLFVSKAGNLYKDEDFADIFEMMYNSPLLIEQLGYYLCGRQRKSKEDIVNLLGNDKFKHQYVHGVNILDRGMDASETIKGFLSKLVIFENLSENEKTVLLHFFVWPDEDISFKVISFLLRYVFEDKDDLEDAIVVLSKKGIIASTLNSDGSCFYKIHGLMKESLNLQVKIEEFDYTRYLKSVVDLDEKYQLLFSEWYQCVEMVGRSICVWELSKDVHILETISDWCDKCGKYDYSLALLKRCIKIKEEVCCPDDLYTLVEYYVKMAQTLHWGLFRYKEAEGFYLKAIKMVEEGERVDYLILECQYNNLAYLYSDGLSNYRLALDYYHKALTVVPKIDDEELVAEKNASLYNNMAKIYEDYLCDYKMAISCYEKTIQYLKPILGKDLEHCILFVDAHNSLARILYIHFNDYKRADSLFAISISLLEGLPSKNVRLDRCLAQTYHNRAEFYEKCLVNKELAERFYKKAINVIESLPSEIYQFNYLLVISYNNLSALQKNKNKALKYIRKAIKVGKSLSQKHLQNLSNLVTAYSSMARFVGFGGVTIEEIECSLKRAIELVEILPSSNVDYQFDRVDCYCCYASFISNVYKDYQSAIEWLDKAIVLLANMSLVDPRYRKYYEVFIMMKRSWQKQL